MQRFSEDSKRRRLIEGVVEQLGAELERRIGQTFSVAELVDVYETAEVWAHPIVHHYAQDQPWAWEMGTVLDATFFRYERRALDYQP